MECNPLWNTEVSAGNCGSKGEHIYLKGSYKDKRAKFILAIPVDIRRGKGHSLWLGRVRRDARKTLPEGGWCSTGAGPGRFWQLSQASQGWPHLLLVIVPPWMRDWAEWPPEDPPSQDSHGAKGCGKTRLLCEIWASKSKESEVKCWRKDTRIYWLKSFVLGREPSIISLAEAVHQLIRVKGYPPLGGSGTKPIFSSRAA